MDEIPINNKLGLPRTQKALAETPENDDACLKETGYCLRRRKLIKRFRLPERPDKREKGVNSKVKGSREISSKHRWTTAESDLAAELYLQRRKEAEVPEHTPPANPDISASMYFDSEVPLD